MEITKIYKITIEATEIVRDGKKPMKFEKVEKAIQKALSEFDDFNVSVKVKDFINDEE